MRYYRRVNRQNQVVDPADPVDPQQKSQVVEEERYNETNPAPVEPAYYNSGWTANRIIWDILAVIEVLLALRFIFLLAGAGRSAFTTFLYNLTNPLVAPFSTQVGATVGFSVLSGSTILAMIVYVLLTWAITAIIDALSAPRCVGPNCYPRP